MSVIRLARPSDAAAVRAVYAPYVLDTAVTFEWELPEEGLFKQRILRTLENYPYLVAEEQGRVVAYSYASRLKERAACDWAAECSVYVEKSQRRRGWGRALYARLEEILLAQRLTNLYVSISRPSSSEVDSSPVDSELFHARAGYEKVAHFHGCGYKFGQWHDLVWMEKTIAPRRPEQEPFIPFSRLAPAWKKKIIF